MPIGIAVNRQVDEVVEIETIIGIVIAAIRPVGDIVHRQDDVTVIALVQVVESVEIDPIRQAEDVISTAPPKQTFATEIFTGIENDPFQIRVHPLASASETARLPLLPIYP